MKSLPEFLLVCLVGLVIGTSAYFITNTSKEPKPTGDYVIMLGSATVSYGRHTNEYRIEDDMVHFYNLRSEQEVSVPKCNVMGIIRQ